MMARGGIDPRPIRNPRSAMWSGRSQQPGFCCSCCLEKWAWLEGKNVGVVLSEEPEEDFRPSGRNVGGGEARSMVMLGCGEY